MSEQPQSLDHIKPLTEENQAEGVNPAAGLSMEQRNALYGIGEHAVAFESAIAEVMANQPATQSEQRQLSYDRNTLVKAETLLGEHGISLSPLAAPAHRNLREFSPQDWQAVSSSQDPVLKLWSTAYKQNVEKYYQNYGESSRHTVRNPERRQHETALVRSLPLVHRTSLRALDGAMTSGVFRSNRALHDSGVDVTTGTGNTTAADRELGLDGYVFADYGRPSSNGLQSSEVVVVFEPEAMQRPGAFLTEKDIQDFDVVNRETGDIECRKYMSGAVLPEDFVQTVVPKILSNDSFRTHYAGRGLGESHDPMELEDFVAGSDSNPDNLGNAHFSTWEAKIPGEVPVGGVRKLIFTTEEGRQDFVAKFGDTIPCEVAAPEELTVNPHPAHRQTITDRYRRNMELFGTQERYEQELAKLRDEDYDRRQTAIAASEDGGEGYMLINHPAPDAPDAEKYDPTWYRLTPRVFKSAEDALLMARRDYDPGGQHAEMVAFGDEVQVTRNGVTQWEKAKPRELKIHDPTVTLAHVRYSPGATVITGLSVEDISTGISPDI